VSSVPNPLPEPMLPPQPVRIPGAEDPPWSGWDVLSVVAVTVVALVLVPLMVVLPARVLVYRQLPLMEIMQVPYVILVAQMLIYIVVFALMFFLIRARTGKFWQPIRWHWPSRSWVGFLVLGAVVYLGLMGLGEVLPIPKHLPIDRFFQNAQEAALMSVLSVTLAPFMEELFFRGLLYPVLARRLGVGMAVFLTGAAFGLLHGAQLKYSWAVLIIFLVGIVLTIVRAVTKSVGASFLVHVGYNGTLSALLFAATGGFRHLERLNQ